MRVLHFDIISGISGDMTMGALCHLGMSLDPLRAALKNMGIVDVEVTSSPVESNGIGVMRFEVVCSEKGHASHRSWNEIRTMLQKAKLPQAVYKRSEDIFEHLAQAEAKVHQTDKERVVFHEVGSIDSIIDIVGCAYMLENLELDLITSSPPLLGHGIVESQHGPIPVPAPATLELLRGIAVRGCDVEQEMTTPTGAAILASQVDRFTNWPDMSVSGIGYGVGTRVIENRPNLLRVVIGEIVGQDLGDEMLIEANIDDMNPEYYEYLMDLLMQNGAHDVWLQPVIMKKSRPATTLAVLCDERELVKIENLIFRESTTIGIRRQAVSRRKLCRDQKLVETQFGTVRMKISGEGKVIWTVAPEYEDCRKLAQKAQVPLKSVFQAAISAWEKIGRDS